MKDDRRSTSTISPPTMRSSVASPENAEGIPLEAIAKRAYELYVASGFQHGKDIEHWLEAERQLRKEPRYR